VSRHLDHHHHIILWWSHKLLIIQILLIRHTWHSIAPQIDLNNIEQRLMQIWKQQLEVYRHMYSSLEEQHPVSQTCESNTAPVSKDHPKLAIGGSGTVSTGM
jgi:hypothetical protein